MRLGRAQSTGWPEGRRLRPSPRERSPARRKEYRHGPVDVTRFHRPVRPCPPPPAVSSTLEDTGCICGAPGTARLVSSSTRVSGARAPAGALSSRRLLDSRGSAPAIERAWATAIPGPRRGRHAGSQASWLNSSRAAELPDRRARRGIHRRLQRSCLCLRSPEAGGRPRARGCVARRRCA